MASTQNRGIWEAIERMNSEEVIDSLKSGCDIKDTDSSGNTPLHRAIVLGSKEIVNILLDRGAEAFVRNSNGQTPLDEASKKNDRGLIHLLINHKDKWGNTLLHRAVACGSKKMVELLLNLGSDVNAKNTVSLTPLHKASSRGNIEVIRLLITNGANIQALSLMGRTPIDVAKSELERQVMLEANNEVLSHVERLKAHKNHGPRER